MVKNLFTGIGVLLILAPSLLSGQKASSKDADNGRRIYMQSGCPECHGFVGQGSPYGARIGPTALPSQMFISYIRHPTGRMPPYTQKVMSDKELSDVWVFLQTIPPPKPVNDIPLLRDMGAKTPAK